MDCVFFGMGIYLIERNNRYSWVKGMETIAAIYLGSCVGEVVLVMIVAGIIIFQWRGR